jgi:hypothetical protein
VKIGDSFVDNTEIGDKNSVHGKMDELQIVDKNRSVDNNVDG